MSDNNRENIAHNGEYLVDEDTQITIPPPAPNFDAAQPVPVQPVIPVATGEFPGGYQQQPQVVYVPHPTVVQPNRSWGWIPAALVLLLVGTIAGAFVGAALYQRSTYAESQPFSPEDVSPSVKTEVNASKSAKASENESAAREKNSTDVPRVTETTSSSVGFTLTNKPQSAKKQESSFAENNAESSEENDGESIAQNDENAENETADPAERKEEKKTVDPAQIKDQLKKVENKKDTENIAVPQRSLPNEF